MAECHGIRLAEDEVVVKEYQATRQVFPKTDGYLIATNRRLLFVGEAKGCAGGSITTREVQVPDVSGITGYMGNGLSIGRVLLIAAMILIFSMAGLRYPLAFLLLAIPGYIFWRMLRRPGSQVVLVIHSRGSWVSPLALRAERSTGGYGLFGSHAHFATVAGPGPDAEAAIREIGALVLDLQAVGNLAKAK